VAGSNVIIGGLLHGWAHFMARVGPEPRLLPDRHDSGLQISLPVQNQYQDRCVI